MSHTLQLDHYIYVEVGDGLFAAIATATGKAGANAAIVDLGESSMLVDTGMTRDAAAELAATTLHLTGRQPQWVVNTHYHSDHCWGNAALGAGVTIISTAGTRQLASTASASEVEWYLQCAPAEITRLDREIRDEGDAPRLESLKATRNFFAVAVGAARSVALRPATVTFERRMQIFGSRRQVTLFSEGGGHTQSDAAVFAPDAGVLVCGDLVTVDAHPYAGEDNVVEWLHTLAVMKTLQPSVLIPGHGPVSQAGAIEDTSRYLNQIIEVAEYAPLDEAERPAWANAERIPPEYAAWAFASFYPRNLLREAERQAGRRLP